jgi:hypothetical protein
MSGLGTDTIDIGIGTENGHHVTAFDLIKELHLYQVVESIQNTSVAGFGYYT